MITVPARDVETGDTLPGLDDGYVFDVEVDIEVSAFTGRYNSLLGTFTVITFHDSEGEENYLIVNSDVPIEIADK